MGGFSVLCCAKGDKGDDSLDPPARPAQRRPEKTAQNAPPSVRNEPASADVRREKLAPDAPVQEKPIQQTPAQRDLWKEAFDNLDPSQQTCLTANGASATAAIKQVIDDTTARYEQWRKGGLKIHRKNGKDIDIRDCAERILGAAMKASNVISTAVSFDPTGQASSAWMVISFGMSIVQNRLDRRNAIFAASEYLAESLSYYALIDINYRNQNVGSDHNLDQALLRVYSAILEFTVEVTKGRDENEAQRTFQSLLALTGQPLQELKDTINAQSVIAEKWVDLAANLGDRKLAAEHLSKTDAVLEELKVLSANVLTTEEESKLTWISDAPYSDRQRDLQKKRAGDTGLWLLESPQYNEWKTTPGSVLWLPGISGCGKSVLCSTVIQDLEEDCSSDPSKLLSYWYFQFGDESTKSADAMARSLIRQLSRSPLPPGVTKIWNDHHRKGSQPDSKAIFGLLDDSLSRITSDVYLVFDALDECPENEESQERGSVLDLLEGLLERHSTTALLHILVTSRSEQDIKRRLDQFSRIDLEAHLAEDVKTFVDSCLAKEPLRLWGPDICALITDELLNSKERRFRWAELQIMALQRCPKEDRIRKALKAIPQTLEATYREVLDNIDPEDYSTAREILIILCLSSVPFDAQTVVDMAGVGFPSALTRICTTSFISLLDEKVQLAHFSVQEFLVVVEEGPPHHPCQFSAANGHRFLTEKTVDILLEQTEALDGTTAKDSDKIPFLYAAKHWNAHMTAAGGIDQLSPDLQSKVNLLFAETNVYWNWVRAADSVDGSEDNEWSKLFEECQPPLHRASMLGLVPVVNCLLEQGAHPFQLYTKFSARVANPLSVAAEYGYCDVLHALLDKIRPLGEWNEARLILGLLDYRKEGRAKLISILQRLWNLGLLQNHSSEVENELDETIVFALTMNVHSAIEITKIFLEWQPKISMPISELTLSHSILCRKEQLGLFLEHCDVRFTPEFLEDIQRPSPPDEDDRASGLALLAIKRPDEVPLNDELLALLAEGLDLEEMNSLMQLRKSEFSVTEDILEKSARNKKSGSIFGLLWPDRASGIVISELMLCNAVANQKHSRELLGFMQEHVDPCMKLSAEAINDLVSTAEEGVATLNMLLRLSPSDLPVSERIVEAICSHKEALDMLSLLIKGGFDIPITESILSSAASNRSATQGVAVIECLARLHQKPLPITESVAVAAVQNLDQNDRILAILLQHASATLLTDRVFEEACQNERAMLLLLDRRQKDLPIRKMILKIAEGGHSTRGVLQALLERNLINIDESVVEALAPNFYPLDTLLSWKPDSPITEKALIAGAKDVRSMRVLLGVPGGAFHVTEDVWAAALPSEDGKSVVQVIFHRRGSIDVTEKILAALYERIKIVRDNLFVSWLFELTSESLVAKFFLSDTWQNKDPRAYGAYRARCSFLVAYARKTVSRISDSMSHGLPFDPKTEEGSWLKELVQTRVKELIPIPANELTALVLVETCYNETIEQIWEEGQLLSTDRVIQGVERNRVADKEKLKSFLERKRG